MNTEIPYSEAIIEIEAILRKFQSDDVSIDTLAAEVRRATKLIEMCRARLTKAEQEVAKVLKPEID